MKQTTVFSFEDTIIIDSQFGKYAGTKKLCYIENSFIDDYSYIGEFGFVQNTYIGKMTSIAAMVRIGATDHPTERAIQHSLTYRSAMFGLGTDDTNFMHKRQERKTIIGHDVWIGHGVIIRPGITIGNGAVIGSGTIVTKDVAPYTIVAKTPQTVIRQRFDEATIMALESIQIWNFSEDQLKKWLPYLRENVAVFLKKWEENHA